jgi:serine/threonine protein kinase
VLKKLGKYELIDIVGRGAMGEVYKAQDPYIGRLVALKTVTSGLLGRPELLERFYQEARSAGTLQHPNIVTIYELGKEADTPFIAMEFLEGETLETIIERRPLLTYTQKVGYLVPVCRALDYAHKRGVVHRDIKPANVMITRETGVKVVDFGIARLMDSTQTQTNTIIGTLGYMSPQQIRGERADERSDIWAAGVMLFELLTYQRPFDGGNQAALMMSIANEATNPAPLEQLAPGIDPAVMALVGKMLQKNAEQRYQSMEEVLFDLEPIYRRMQDASVAEMIAGGESLIRDGNFARARDVLRKALQMDSRNQRAKTLLEQLNAHLGKSAPSRPSEVNLEKARELLKVGRHTEARIEIEAAQKSDPDNQEAKELLAEAERAAERVRQVLEALKSAKQKLADGSLDEASEATKKLLELEPRDTQGRELMRQIRELISDRERRKRLTDTLQKGRNLWAEGKRDECIALLTKAREEFPGDAEIAKFAETARRERNASKPGATTTGAGARASLPGEPGAKDSGENKDERARQEELRARTAQIRAKINAGEYTAALDLAQQTLATLGPDERVAQLQRAAEVELEQKRDKQRRQEKSFADAQSRMAEGKFADATGILKAGIADRLFSREDQRVNELFGEIERRKQAAAPPPTATISRRGADVAGKDYAAVKRPTPEPAAAQASASGALAAAVVSQPDAGAAERTTVQLRRADKVETNKPEAELASEPVRARAAERESSSNVGVWVAVLVAVAIAAAFVGYKYMGFGAPTTQELALQSQAQQAEQNKDWPGALADYKNLGNLNGKLAENARTQQSRLQELVNREVALLQQAQNSSLSGNVTAVRDSYQQVADLHGDREQEAQDAIEKLDAAIEAPAPAASTPDPTPAAATPVAATPTPAPTAKAKPVAAKPAKKAAPKQSAKADSGATADGATAKAPSKSFDSPNCQLVASDIPRFLELADGNRGKGKYADAEREYSAVLECDSQNDRARTGLARTKTAEVISGGR